MAKPSGPAIPVVSLVILAVSWSSMAAQPLEGPARRVTSISRGISTLGLSGGRSPTLVGSRLYFVASDEINGTALWVGDAGGAPARLLKVVEAQNVVERSGQAFFLGSQGEDWALWKSDGTPEGTAVAKELPAGSYPSNLTAAGGRLYFVGPDGTPWVSDGTVAGTRSISSVTVSPSYSIAFLGAGAVVYFIGLDASRHLGLWRIQGTPPAALEVADLGPLTASDTTGRFIYGLAEAGGRIFFVSKEAGAGYRLWSSDGTTAGTVVLHDFIGDYGSICPGSCFPIGPSLITDLNGVALFAADDGLSGRELWRSDGTTAGTRLVKDIFPGLDGSIWLGVFMDPGGAASSSSHLLFVADDGLHGSEPWSTDGTEAGTRLLSDITAGSDSSSPFWFVSSGGFVFFEAQGQTWHSDGTASGTEVFRNISGWLSPLSEGFAIVSESGLWQSDGTDVVLIDDLKRPQGFRPTLLTNLSGRLVFTLPEAYTTFRTLWESDGTEAGTRLVRGFPRSLGNSARPTAIGGELYFDADDGEHGQEPWISDGTEAGTRLLADISPGDSGPWQFVSSAGRTFFVAFDGTHGVELWSTDGTTAGTRLVDDLYNGPEGSVPDGLTPFRGDLFFTAYQPSGLWRTDGTAAGTVRVKTRWASRLTAVGDTLFFVGGDDEHGDELWKSDGTEEGTALVKDIVPGPSSPNIYAFVAAGGKLFFRAQAFDGEQLWVSDGTEAGTRSLRDSPVGIDGLTAVGGSVFFTDGDTEHGRELWRSDGTTEGTVLVRDLHPGRAGSDPWWLTEVNGLLLFSADDGEHGVEPWRSDGTEEGTFMIQDIAPGPASSSPAEFCRSGRLVYFRASDPEAGSQLWAMPTLALEPLPERHPRVVPFRD